MQLYLSPSPNTDLTFLAGEEISCPIAISVQDDDQGAIVPGHTLVFQLTNGAKYKAVVVEFRPVRTARGTTGHMMIRRWP